ncbi:hypothetical protein B0181_07360 [Moraxella caviae]|uniref:Uncharacterized protein n=1 Tax=Moraxella caviae TaxID=34060 RepID=A0A1T0A0S0_9GAMM|nr:hypothetical protein B0181_07360 [Moraxella caviae]
MPLCVRLLYRQIAKKQIFCVQFCTKALIIALQNFYKNKAQSFVIPAKIRIRLPMAVRLSLAYIN